MVHLNGCGSIPNGSGLDDFNTASPGSQRLVPLLGLAADRLRIAIY
jgi:hypothetical protein